MRGRNSRLCARNLYESFASKANTLVGSAPRLRLAPATAVRIWYKGRLTRASKKEPYVNRTIIAITLIGLTIPALAASARYYLEIDTVGNCSVVDSKPSDHAGMMILGDKNGYASKQDAAKALKALPKDKCRGIVG